jgi:hypothetical protein
VNVSLTAPVEVPSADLHIPVLGQLPPAELALGDALEEGPLEVVRLGAGWGWRAPAKDVASRIGSVFPSVQTGHGDRSRYFGSLDQKHAAMRR